MPATLLKFGEELARFPPTLWSHKFIWHIYPDAIRVFRDDSDPENIINFWTDVKNFVFITALSVQEAVLCSPLIGYGLSRIIRPGRDRVFLLVFRDDIHPSAALLVAMFYIWAMTLRNLFNFQFIDTH